MSGSLERDGYEIHRALFDDRELERMRDEADSVAAAAGSACVRHLRSRSGVFDDLCASGMLQQLLPPGMRPVRSILFDKTPDENWPVAWHQDLTIAVARRVDAEGYGPWSAKDGSPHVQPPVCLLERMVTIRIHLDDTPDANGALRVMPGSHRLGRIAAGDIAGLRNGQEVVCECRAGDVLLMSPLILHASRRAEQPTRRRIVHCEYAREGDLDPRLEWLERGR